MQQSTTIHLFVAYCMEYILENIEEEIIYV